MVLWCPASRLPVPIAAPPLTRFNLTQPSSGRLSSKVSFQTTTTSAALKTSTMANSFKSSQAKDFGHYKLLASFDIKYAPVKIARWRSSRTGLTVVVGSHAAPIVSSTISRNIGARDETGRRMDTLRLHRRVRYRMCKPGLKSDRALSFRRYG
jgi:hypothetical protein